MGKRKENKRQTVEQEKKTYSSVNKENSETCEDMPGDIKVQLSEQLEKELLGIIHEHKRVATGTVSGRMTAKKLTDMYTSLLEVGFTHTQIVDAMTNTVTSGGDLMDALDWLCLFTPNEQLPNGFSQAIHKEGEKLRPKFTDLPKDVPPTSHIQPPVPMAQIPAQTSTSKDERSKAAGVKDWILQYTEQESSSDEDEGGGGMQAEEEFDPDEKYLELAAKLLDTKTVASLAKQGGDKEAQRAASKTIRELTVAIGQLELHPRFNPQVKISFDDSVSSVTAASPAPSGEPVISVDSPEEEEGDLGFSMFDESAEQETPVANDTTSTQPKEKVRRFEYTQKQWTGKSPKQFLNDWCRKNLPKNSKAPSYHKKQAKGNLFKCKVVIERKKDPKGDLSVCPDILCENVREAEHLASTLALYELCRGQRVYQLLPPPYRDIWLEWQEAEDKEKQVANEETNKPRDKFVASLLKKMKSNKAADDTASTDDVMAEEDTWESFADDEFTDLQQADPVSRSSGTARLKELFLQNTKTSTYNQLLKTRRELPVFQYKDEIMSIIARENVVVVAGETGSGKSTQVPQFILEHCLISNLTDKCNIVVTEPRRISATSLATRVSQELGGGNPGSRTSMCGYQIRFESKRTANTCLTYCTTGVLLRKLQNDPELKDVTHIIVDEVHERSIQSDFLLIILRHLVLKRPEVKVILMSATLDSDKFSAYFQHCSVINIPGRTFPVQVYHLEDIVEQTGYTLEQDSPYALRYEDIVQEQSTCVTVTGQRGDTHKVNATWTTDDLSSVDTSNLSPDEYSKKTRTTITRMNFDRINMEVIVTLLTHLDRDSQYSQIDGAVLVFLPGLSHIQELYELITSDRTLGDESRYCVIALHSVLTSQDQSKAFDVPKKGVRKIVIATNIAETGITIPDAVFVVDCGTVKENRYMESSQMSTLEEVYISKASAKQRQGRAGRTREGWCFRLYTKHTYSAFKSYSVPEILRVPLEELCLHIMKCDLGDPATLLSQALDPPQVQTVTRAMNLLRDVGACEYERSVLTPLGQHLATLPVNVRIGKMLIFGAIFGCLEPVAVIAASITDKSPFVVPLGKRDLADAARRALSIANSDHLTVYKAYLGWRAAKCEGTQAEFKYCQRFFLKRTSLLDIDRVKDELIKLVCSIGFSHPASDARSHKSIPAANSDGVIKARDVLDISKTTKKQKLEPSPQEVAMVKAVLTAGLYPNVARTSYIQPVDAAANPTQTVCVADTPQGPVAAHPSSVNRFLGANGHLVYLEKVKLSRVYIRDSTLISAYPLLLFGGLIDVQHLEKVVSVDGWIQFRAFAKTGVLFKELRVLIRDLLQSKLENPSLCITDDPIVKAIIKLVSEECS